MKIREFVSIGDLHLTDSTGKNGLSSYIKDPDTMIADLVISQPLKWARANGVKHIVLLGDICDGTRMSYSAQLQLLRILRTPFHFHIIPGNHDMIAEDPVAGHSLQLIKEFRLPNVSIYETPTVVDKVKFCPWPCAEFDKKLMNIAHIDVQGSRTDSGRLNASEKLTESKAAAVIGHIHTAQTVRNSCYPGNLYQTNFGESQDKFFGHSVYDDGWETNLIAVKPKYRLHTIEVSHRRDLKKVPASEYDLIKLILKEAADVTAAHYQHLNVVKVKTANSAAELALAHVEDLADGSNIEISTTEFISAWLAQRALDDQKLKAIMKVRHKILKGNAK